MPKVGSATTGLGTGQYNATTPSLNDKDEIVLQVDNAGNLMVKTVNTGSGSNPAAGATGSAVPADADYQGVNIGGTLTGVSGLAAGATVKAMTVAVVDGSGNQVTAFGGSASAIASNYHVVAAASNNAALIKGSAGTLFGVRIFNNAAYPVYVKLYNSTSNPPVPGTTAVFKTFGCQSGTQRDIAITGGGLTMGTGIGISILKDLADSGTTAVAANDCVVDVEYT